MMYVLPPHLISLSRRSRLLQLRSPISTYPLPNPWVIRPPSSSLPSACSSAASLSSCSRTRTRPYSALMTMARRLPASGHSGPYSSAAPQFMLVERSSRSTGSFLRLAETAGRISLRGVRLEPPVSALASFTAAPFPLWISTCTQVLPPWGCRGWPPAPVSPRAGVLPPLSVPERRRRRRRQLSHYRNGDVPYVQASTALTWGNARVTAAVRLDTCSL